MKRRLSATAFLLHVSLSVVALAALLPFAWMLLLSVLDAPDSQAAPSLHWPWLLTLSNYAVSYTHLRAHETVLDLVCRLLLEKNNNNNNKLTNLSLITEKSQPNIRSANYLCRTKRTLYATHD